MSAHFGRAPFDDIVRALVTLEPAGGICVAPVAGTRAALRALNREGDQMDDDRTKRPTDDFGDDQGTRVGESDKGVPRQHSDAPTGRPERQTGAGSEASEGMHNAQQGSERGEQDATGLAGSDKGRSAREGGDRAGSEPLTEDEQHRSGYGGAGGRPVTSSDEREGPRKQ